MNSCDWPPLESDPEIFNKYFYSIGLPKQVYFKELISLTDSKEFITVGGPLCGIILNFQKGSVKTVRKEGNCLPPEFVPFFMKQTSKLDNACGLIAALHAFGNSFIEYKDKSILKELFEKAVSVNFEERAKLLEGCEKAKSAHKAFASEGQTKLTNEDVKGHFICFINYQDCIYELDGCTSGPYIVKENVSFAQFIDETGKEILRRIQDGEIKEQVNVMLVADENTQLVDLLGD